MTGAVLSPERKEGLRRAQAAVLKIIDGRMEELKRELRKSPWDAKSGRRSSKSAIPGTHSARRP